jgi:hypothetical protein
VGHRRPVPQSLFGSSNSSDTDLVLAVCIGSHWPGPLNFPSSREDLNKFVGEWRSKFREAKDILLVGAGAVGLGMIFNFLLTLLLTGTTIQNLRES